MASVISMVSSKGGTGKTTTALNLSVALAESGRRVLLVDLDPQGGIAFSVAKGDGEWIGLADVASGSTPLEECLFETKIPTLSILPRGRLDPVDVSTYESFLLSSGTVREIVDRVREDWDYVILDSPSGLGGVTRAGLSAADFALVPLQAEPLALRSIGQVLRVIDHVQREENPALKLLGILPTGVRLDLDASLNVMSTAWGALSGVLETAIPRSDVFAQASELGIPVAFLGGRTRPEARRFQLLADEIESLIGESSDSEGDRDETMHRELI